MSYVLVTADFPGVTGEHRNRIYECLSKKGWKKIHEPGRDIDTVWSGSFPSGTPETVAIQSAISNFSECSKPCKPKLVIHWGPNEPTRYGLV